MGLLHYIVFPNVRSICDFNVHGFFVSLNYDLGNHRRDLSLVLDAMLPNANTYLASRTLCLAGTLEESVSATVTLMQSYVEKDGGSVFGFATRAEGHAYLERLRQRHQDQPNELAPLVSLTLYLASANRELRSGTLAEPVRPKVQHTRRGGPRIFPPPVPRVWEVGYRIGATIRAGQANTHDHRPVHGSEERIHSSPRPHLRKAHYHHFWTGPLKGERKLIVRWLHPILVAAGENEDPGIVPTVHRVAGPLTATAGAGSGLNQPAPEASRDNAARDR
jgi:hypothetical protein